MHLLPVVLGLSIFAAEDWRAHWNDGKAEVASYTLVQPRYGELRKGSAVLVFVREDFSNSARVKADPGVHPAGDVFPVMKLNFIKAFQTGIYDYNLMSSIFVGLEPAGGRAAGAPAKMVFSSQEWCGALFDELLFDARSIRQNRMSYFDREGDESKTIERLDGGITADELPFIVRGLPSYLVELGASRELPILSSLERSRLLHRPLAWGKGKISRNTKNETLELWTIDTGNGEKYEYEVERAYPHRIRRWTGPDGEEATLIASERLRYWEMHREGDEKNLSKLGLQPMPPPSKP